MAFAQGNARVLVTKPIIGAWGLNFQHCAHMVYFPSHSYEQYYQSVRRCWRFGQKRPVTVDLVLTEGERRVQQNLGAQVCSKPRRCSPLLVEQMNDALGIQTQPTPLPNKLWKFHHGYNRPNHHSPLRPLQRRLCRSFRGLARRFDSPFDLLAAVSRPQR